MTPRRDGPRPRASGGRAHPLVAGDTSRARGPGGAFTWGRRVGKAEGLRWDSKGPVPTAQSGGQSRPAPGIRAGRGVWVAGGQQWGPCADEPDPASDCLALDHLPTSRTSSRAWDSPRGPWCLPGPPRCTRLRAWRAQNAVPSVARRLPCGAWSDGEEASVRAREAAPRNPRSCGILGDPSCWPPRSPKQAHKHQRALTRAVGASVT